MAYRGRYAAANGGGYNNCGAMDPLIRGHYVAGGDVWGLRFTLNSGNSWWGANWGLSGSFPNCRTCFVSKRSATAGMALYGTGTYNMNGGDQNGDLLGSDFSNPYKVIHVDSTHGFGNQGYGSGAGNTPAGAAKRPVGDMIDSVVVSGTEYIFTVTAGGVFRYTNAGSGAAAISGPTQLATPTDLPASNFFTTIRVLDASTIIVIAWDRNGTGGTALPAQINTVIYLLKPTTGTLATATGTSQVTVSTLSHPIPHVYDLKQGKDGNYYAACGVDGYYRFALSGSSPVWTPLYNADNFATGVDCTSTGVMWGGQAGGVASNDDQQNMTSGHAAVKSNASQTSFSYPAAAAGAIKTAEFQEGDGTSGTGRAWWLGSDPRAFDGSAYDCQMIRVDPFDDNRVIMFGRAGAWMTRDGGATFHPTVNGMNGVESHAVKMLAATSVSSDGTDAPNESHSSDLYKTAVRGTKYSGGGQGLPAGTSTHVGDDNVTYTFTHASGSAPAKLSKAGVGDITTDEFRGAIVNANGIAISQNGTVFISQFGGGVFVMDPGGTPPSTPPAITSFTPTSTTVGSTVTVSGLHFTGATTVKVGTTTAATFNVVDDATLTFVVPTGAATGAISITTPQGTGTSSTSLTVGGVTPPSAPTITSFTPTTGVAGTAITVTGTNLGSATAVKIGGSSGTPVTPSSNTSTQIVFAIPAGASSGVIYVQTTGGSVTSTQTLTVSTPPQTGAPVIANLPQGKISRTATMQVRTMWTTDAQAAQVARECVLISGPFSMPRLATMMTTNPNLIITPYLKSIQNAKGTNTFDPNGTVYPAKWYAHLKDGTKAIQASPSNWVMESGYWSESRVSATVQGDLSGNSITASSWADYHVKDAVANIAKVNAQSAQQGTNPFRGLWLDSMSTFSADNVTGFWGTTNPGWNPHTNTAYTKPDFRLMAYYMGDQARTVTLNPNNLWVVGNGLREAGIADHVDMAMAEGWLVSSAGLPSYTQTSYETKLQLLLDCQAKGAVAEVLEWGQTSDTAAQTTQKRRYLAASYLIAHRGLATMEWGTLKSTGPWLETGADRDLYAINLGAPLTNQSPTVASGHRVAVGTGNGQAASAGLYARLFASGTAIVNITGAAINYKASKDYTLVPLPGGGAATSYVSGNLISIPAQSGVILTTQTSAATAPANTSVPYVLNSTVEGSTLTRDPGNWTGNPDPSFTDQWQVSPDGSTGWADIAGATSATFQIPFGTSGSSVTTVATDAFARTLATGWGNADTGGAYTIDQGTSTDFAVASGRGTISHAAVNTGKMATLPLNVADCDVYLDVNFPAAAAGGNLHGSLMVRFQDTSNYLDLNAIYSSSTGVVGVNPRKVIAGTATTIGTQKSFNSYVVTDNLHLRLKVTGSRIQGKAWQGAATEPAGWDWDVTDSTLTAAGDIGARSFRGAANTNTSPQTRWDNLQVQTNATTVSGYVGQYFRVRTTGANTAGTVTANSAAVGPVTSGVVGEPQWTAQPSITGTPVELGTLTAKPGSVTGTPTPTVTYQWQSSPDGAAGTWTNISGETASTTVPATGSATDYYRVRVRATNTGGTLDSYAPRVGPITTAGGLPQFTTDPSLTGDPVVGSQLIADPGVASGSPTPAITIQFQRSPDNGATWQNIAPPSANNLTYTLTNADVGDLIRVTAVATNTSGADQAYSTPIGPVQYPVVFGSFQISVTVE